MVPTTTPSQITTIDRQDFLRIPTGDIMPGVIYIIRESLVRHEPPPVKDIKPWVRWKQHPKGPHKGMKQASRQPGA